MEIIKVKKKPHSYFFCVAFQCFVLKFLVDYTLYDEMCNNLVVLHILGTFPMCQVVDMLRGGVHQLCNFLVDFRARGFLVIFLKKFKYSHFVFNLVLLIPYLIINSNYLIANIEHGAILYKISGTNIV